jgi:hypothetical protein
MTLTLRWNNDIQQSTLIKIKKVQTHKNHFKLIEAQHLTIKYTST